MRSPLRPTSAGTPRGRGFDRIRTALLGALAAFLAAMLGAVAGARAQVADEIASDAAGTAAVEIRELERDGQTLWLYRPRSRAPRGLIAIPPAGGTLLTAPGLGPGDRAEHLPYAEAGFAVVAFSLSGELSGRVTRDDVLRALDRFQRSRAGVSDARRAITAASTELELPEDLPVFAAGHSSAANTVLALASEDPRVSAVAVFAPAADAPAFIEGSRLQRIAREVPGALERVAELSPLELARSGRLETPILLFHAEDDAVTSFTATQTLARELRERGTRVELVTPSSGGHYDGMLERGIPAALRWFEQELASRVR